MRNQSQDPAATELRVAALFNILQVRADLTAGGTDLIGRCLTRPPMPLRIKTLTHKPKSLPTLNLMLSHRSTDVSRTVSFFCVCLRRKQEVEKLNTVIILQSVSQVKVKEQNKLRPCCLFPFGLVLLL